MSTLTPVLDQVAVGAPLCQHRYFRPGPHRDIWIGSRLQQKPHDVNPVAACCFPQNVRLCPPLLASSSDGSRFRCRFTAYKSSRRASFQILSIPKRPLWPERGLTSSPHSWSSGAVPIVFAPDSAAISDY